LSSLQGVNGAINALSSLSTANTITVSTTYVSTLSTIASTISTLLLSTVSNSAVVSMNLSLPLLGIGTTNPATGLPSNVPNTLLTSYTSTNPTITLGNATNNTALQLTTASNTTYSTWATSGDMVLRNTAGNLIFQSGGGAGAIYINTSNNVGIGTTVASNLLTIGAAALPTGSGTTNLVVNGNIGLYNNRICFSTVTNSFSDSIYNNNPNMDNEGVFNGFKYNGTAGHSLNVGTTPSLFMNSTGNIGIGTSTVTGKLNIYSNITPTGTAGDVVIQHGTNGVSCIVFPNQAQNNFGSIAFYDNVTATTYSGYTGANYSAYNYWNGSGTEVAALVIGIGTANSSTGLNSIVLNPAGNVIVAPQGGYTYITGNVGMGTTNPSYPLHVIGGAYINGGVYINGTTKSAAVSSREYFGTNGSTVTGLYGGTSTIVLSATGDIGIDSGKTFWLSSDRRIKTNIQSAQNMLSLIEKINVVSYSFVDQLSHSQKHCSAGIIAQQLINVLPQSVTKTKDFIPNILQNAFSFRLVDEYTVEITVLSDLNVKVGDVIRYFVYKSKDDATEYKHTITYVSDDYKTIHLPAWDGLDNRHRVTLYGTLVHDFHNVDKLMITMLMVGGVKELHEFSSVQCTRIRTLQTRLQNIKQTIEDLTSIIDECEQLIVQRVE